MNLKKAVLLKSLTNFLKRIPLSFLFFFLVTEQNAFTLQKKPGKPRKKILVGSNSSRGNGDNFTAERERETVSANLSRHQKSASRVKTLSIVSAITAKR